MRGLTGDGLLGLPVRLRGIQLGRAVDVLLHPTATRALGVDVLCGDDRHRFLPFSAASLGDGHLEAGSPFVLLELQAGSFYRTEARTLSELRGRRVGGDGATLEDVVLDPAWEVVGLVLEDSQGRRVVPLDGHVLPARKERGGAGRRPRGPRRSRARRG